MSLKRFLKTLDDDRATRYGLAYWDLNADGTPEAIVHCKKWCGAVYCTRQSRHQTEVPGTTVAVLIRITAFYLRTQ